MTVKERFLNYVSITTTSDETSKTCPSTPSQLILGKKLVEELKSLGVKDARIDENGYVYGTVPAKGASKVSMGLIAHMDTSDAVKGDVKPVVIPNYDGGAITLKNGAVIDGFDFLPTLKGQELIVTSGDSVLGADDKAGVAEIMQLVERLMAPDAPDHCKVCVGFTPDEEIGRGADLFDLKHFGADYGYTVDGGPIGELEYENFNAASCVLRFHGVSIHPGSAKNQMKNACLMAMEWNSMLPALSIPACTEGYEGFYHLCGMSGDVENVTVVYIIRDHDADSFARRKAMVCKITDEINKKYGEGSVELELKDSYYNMKEKIEPHMEIIDRAKAAFRACGVEPQIVPVRGGTDGARLSYDGLPCPNLSTGGYNFHGRKEMITVEALEKMTDVLQALVTSI